MKTLKSRTSFMIALVMCFTCASIGLFNLPAVAQTNEQVAKEVIAITKAEWAAQMGKEPIATIMQNVADEYTEFNSDSPTRLDGKDMNLRLFDVSRSGSDETVAMEMANEKVQVYGDVAILSYNFVGYIKNKDGKVESSLALSTRVYVKKGSKWMLVHGNFAPVK
jgi:ketosteroid isomerase-like protein